MVGLVNVQSRDVQSHDRVASIERIVARLQAKANQQAHKRGEGSILRTTRFFTDVELLSLYKSRLLTFWSTGLLAFTTLVTPYWH